jgi:Amt family ammonium transporter
MTAGMFHVTNLTPPGSDNPTPRPEDDAESAPCGLFVGCTNYGSIFGANVVFLFAVLLWIGGSCTVVVGLCKLNAVDP